MKNLKLYLIISICINILLSYIVLKKEPNYTNVEQYLLDKVKSDNIAKKEKIKLDSLRYIDNINRLTLKVSKIQKQRKNERTNYEIELSKLQSINSDSAYTYILDSIKEVCCPNGSR